jgi:deoxyribodipyrimidine photolyase-related protein
MVMHAGVKFLNFKILYYIKMKHLILPTQLYDLRHLNKAHEYILYEHPHYYNEYNYNKKKLILLKASMLYYYDYLYENGYNVKHCKLNENINKYLDGETYLIFDPIDRIKLPKHEQMLDTPNFILTNENLMEYKKKSKSYHMYGFYNYVKKTIKYLVNVKSQDKKNRNRYDDKVEILDLPSNRQDEYYINKAIAWVNKEFSNNIGDTNNFIFPITHKTANKWLTHFLQNNFEFFGKYQDSIVKDEQFLFHSVLSTSINIGLINPIDIINRIKSDYGDTLIESREGYVRQLGWRELCRYTYVYVDFDKNYFNVNENLNSKWYYGELNIKPVDDVIKSSIKYGYAHHINRLMVIGNYMLLNEIHPDEVFKWFMEVYADAYLWVMLMNVEMATFATGGVVTKRPYFSSSNYILKMSDYKKDKWSEIWDELYYEFLKRHKRKLWKYRYYFRALK